MYKFRGDTDVGGDRDEEQERYHTWEDAEQRHKEIVEEFSSPERKL